MTLAEISQLANDYTDENFSTGMLRGFANTAISKINVTVGAKLPLYDAVESYTALSSDWQNAVVVPYMCWSIKMNDSSLNEAGVYLNQYRQGIEELKRNKKTAIDEVFHGDGFQTIHTIAGYSGMRGTPSKGSKFVPGEYVNPYEGDE